MAANTSENVSQMYFKISETHEISHTANYDISSAPKKQKKSLTNVADSKKTSTSHSAVMTHQRNGTFTKSTLPKIQ